MNTKLVQGQVSISPATDPGRGTTEQGRAQNQGIADLGPSRLSAPFASVWREPPWWLSIRSSCSRRRSKAVLFSVLFSENALD